MKVLIILAAYNGEKYIKEQLQSILLQNNVSVDILVFDDCSTDQTVNVIRSLNEKRVQIIKNNTPTGSAANNFCNAVKNLTDEFIDKYSYIAFSDQDDIWLPDKLSAATKKLKETNSGLYLSNLILWNERSNEKRGIRKNYPQKKFDFLFEGGSAGCTYVFSSELCIRLKQQLLLTSYTNWHFFSHDWFVYFFARLNKYPVYIDGSAYIIYRIHAQNVYGQLNTGSLAALKKKLMLIRHGWYFDQIENYIKLIPVISAEEKIYQYYIKNWYTRFFILVRYNFSLMRSKRKFIQFAILSLLIFPKKSN